MNIYQEGEWLALIVEFPSVWLFGFATLKFIPVQ